VRQISHDDVGAVVLYWSGKVAENLLIAAVARPRHFDTVGWWRPVALSALFSTSVLYE
jgi:hypothetical protein